MKNVKSLTGSNACKKKIGSAIGRLNAGISPAKKLKGEARNAIIDVVSEGGFSTVSLKKSINKLIDEAYSEAEGLHPIQVTLEREKELAKKLAIRGAESIPGSSNPNPYERGGKVTVDIFGEKMTTRVDLFQVTPTKVTAVLIETGKPVIKERGRTAETSVKRSPIIYALLEAAKNKGIAAGMKDFHADAHILYLRSTQDKGAELNPSDFLNRENYPGWGLDVRGGQFSPADVEAYEESYEEARAGREYKKSDCEFCELKNHCNFAPLPPVSPFEKNDSPISAMSFTPAQKEAITFGNGVARVIAGAGSGKTTVTCVRVAELVSGGTDPSSILFIAFTNASVKATKEKLAKVFEAYGFDTEEAEKVNVFTFNSFGGKILEEHYKKSVNGFTAPPQVIDEVQKVDILISALNLMSNPSLDGFDTSNPFLNFGKNKGLIPKLLEILENFWEYDFTSYSEEEKNAIANIYSIYRNAMAKANLVTYDDQIALAGSVLADNPELVDGYGLEHIIVDEFQDTSDLDLSLLTELINSSCFKSLMVVGDDMQSVYGFRGAKPEIFMELPSKIGMNVRDIYLTDNFRSTDTICHKADRIGEQITKKLPKKLVAHKKGNTDDILYFTPRMDYKGVLYPNETGLSAAIIADRLARGTKPSDIAFIARKRSEVLAVQKELSAFNIPTKTDLSVNAVDNSRVKAAIGLAKYLLSLITEGTDGSEIGVYDYLDAIYGGELDPTHKNIDLVKRNIATLKDMFNKAEEEEKRGIFLNLCNNLDNTDVVYGKFLESLENYRKARIGTLLGYVVKLQTYNVKLEVRADSSMEAVTLLTAHSSKGLEFGTVVVSLSESFEKQEGESEDDRWRLIYVACTRAKEKLILASKHSEFYRTL